MKGNAPMNALTGDLYTRSNYTTLMATGRQDQIWATFDQWLKLGKVVKKGQKGTKVCRVVKVKRTFNKDENDDLKTRVKWFSVFNIEQVILL